MIIIRSRWYSKNLVHSKRTLAIFKQTFRTRAGQATKTTSNVDAIKHETLSTRWQKARTA